MSNNIVSMFARIPFGKVWAAMALAATLVVAPLLTFSETTLKGIMDRWLAQCTVVVDIDGNGLDAPIVRVYSFGDMPESIPLTFSGGKYLIERISLLNHVEQDTISSDPNLLVHPLANQRCPGDLCPESGDASEKLTVRIRPVTPNYVYQFRVLFKDKAVKNELKTYVKPLINEKIACRVESTTFSNYLARQSRGTQVFILFLGVVVLTLALGFLRNYSRGKHET